LLFTAKGQNVPTLLVGHVTKEGSLAGPKALEHIVDTVLYFEGERHHSHRVVRAVKNRFGAVSELGVFEMTAGGLVPVPNPSKLFLAERPVNAPGSAVLCAVEGSRPMLVEVQALVSTSMYGTARGWRAASISSAVAPARGAREAGRASPRGDDVFVNVAGGMSVDEPGSDLAVLAAIASSVRNRVDRGDTAMFGEVGLAGEVRAIAQAPLRVREASQMGFTAACMPEANIDGPATASQGRANWSASGPWGGDRRSVRVTRRMLKIDRRTLIRVVWLGLCDGPLFLMLRGPRMAWFALARVLFVAVVTYAAAVLHPLPYGTGANVAAALVLAGVIVLFERHLGNHVSTARGHRRPDGCDRRPGDRAGGRNRSVLGRQQRSPR
jgi:hypothetical protein